MSLSAAFSNLNWLAVIAAWLMHVIVSLAWYQPVFFGKAWVKLSGKDMKPATRWIPAGFAAHFVCVLALALIINLANATRLLDGIALGILVSIGFVGAILAGELVWEKIPFKLFLIRLGDQILTLALAGLILTWWR